MTDANDNQAIAGATVKAVQNGTTKRQTSTDANGFYRMQLPVGQYTIQVSKTNYETGSAQVTIDLDQTTTTDFSLRTPRGEVTPPSLEFVLQRNQTDTKTLTLSNTGGLPMTWDVKESGGGAAMPSRGGSKLHRIELSKDERANPGWAGNQAHGHAPRVDAGAPLAPTWSTIANYPTGIMDNSTAFIDGKEYSVGGFDSNFVITNVANVYNPGSNTWAPIANTPMAREKPGVAAVNGLLYVTGGWDTFGTPIAETDVYDPSTNTWSTVAPNPSPTAAPGVAVADGKIYFVGGCADGACTPSAHVARYDPSSDSWDSVASYPTTDSWRGAAGSAARSTAPAASAVRQRTARQVYDPGTDSWSPIAAMPIDLWGSWSAGERDARRLGRRHPGDQHGHEPGVPYDPSTDRWTGSRTRSSRATGGAAHAASTRSAAPREDSAQRRIRRSCPNSIRRLDGRSMAVGEPDQSRRPGRHDGQRHRRHARAGSGQRLPGHPDVPHQQRPAPEPAGPGAAGRAGVGPQLRRRRVHERRRRAVVGRSGIHNCKRGGLRPVSEEDGEHPLGDRRDA